MFITFPYTRKALKLATGRYQENKRAKRVADRRLIFKRLAHGVAGKDICKSLGITNDAFRAHVKWLRQEYGARPGVLDLAVKYMTVYLDDNGRREWRESNKIYLERVAALPARNREFLAALTEKPERYAMTNAELAVAIGVSKEAVRERIKKLSELLGLGEGSDTIRIRAFVVSALYFKVDESGGWKD